MSRKDSKQELEKEPEGASKVARGRERITRARHEERARDASSSRANAGNDPHHVQLNRVSVMTSLPENKAMMQTWAILRVTRGDPESRLGRKEKQRDSGLLSSMAKKTMNGWRPKRNGCEFTVVPDEICSLPTTITADPS